MHDLVNTRADWNSACLVYFTCWGAFASALLVPFHSFATWVDSDGWRRFARTLRPPPPQKATPMPAQAAAAALAHLQGLCASPVGLFTACLAGWVTYGRRLCTGLHLIAWLQFGRDAATIKHFFVFGETGARQAREETASRLTPQVKPKSSPLSLPSRVQELEESVVACIR